MCTKALPVATHRRPKVSILGEHYRYFKEMNTGMRWHYDHQPQWQHRYAAAGA